MKRRNLTAYSREARQARIDEALENLVAIYAIDNAGPRNTAACELWDAYHSASAERDHYASDKRNPNFPEDYFPGQRDALRWANQGEAAFQRLFEALAFAG